MKKFFHILNLCICICILCSVGCTKERHPVSDDRFIHFDNPSELLPLLASKGYTVYSLSETDSTYILEFNDHPQIMLSAVQRFGEGVYTFDRSKVVSATGDRRYVYLTFGNNTSVTFPLNTDEGADVLVNASNADYLIEDLEKVHTVVNGYEGDYHYVTFRRSNPVNSVKGVKQNFESIYVNADDVNALDDALKYAEFRFADGRTARIDKTTLKFNLETDDVLFLEGDSKVQVGCSLFNSGQPLTVDIKTTTECVKAVWNVDSDGNGGTITLEHQPDVKTFQHFENRKWVDGNLIWGEFMIDYTASDKTDVTVTVSNGQESIVRTVKTEYDDLIRQFERIATNYFFTSGKTKDIDYRDNEEKTKQLIGLTEIEPCTWYQHIPKDPGSNYYDFVYNGGTNILSTDPIDVNNMVIIQDEESKNWLFYKYSEGYIHIYILENNTGHMRVGTISLRKKYGRKTIYIKTYSDYRTCEELYGPF